MAEEDRDEPFGRPLPNVGIPLLREERRRVQQRVLLGAALAVVLVAAGVAGALGYATLTGAPSAAVSASQPDGGTSTDGSAESQDGGAEALASAPADAGNADTVDETQRVETPEEHAEGGDDAPVTPGAVKRQRFAFGQAAAFRTALTNAGLSRTEATAVETALDGVLDFRRCRPDHKLVVERDAAGLLLRFEYRVSATATDYAAVTRDDGGRYRGHRVQVPIERVALAKAGRVTTTLGSALEAAGLDDVLVGAFVEAFRGKADFSHDTRAGDTFRILVEEERVHGRFLRYGRVRAIAYAGGGTGSLRAYWHEPARGRGEFYDAEAREVSGSWLVIPCRFDRISSQFDPRRMHPVLRRIQPHNGTDFAAPTGTPVWAAAAGVITWAGPKGPNGNLVSIQHDGGYTTHYAHLHRITAGITRGARVTQRQSIGQVGTTGRSTGPHLHFGLKRGSTFLDPMSVLNGPGRQLTGDALAAFRRVQRALDRELDAIALPG